MTEIKSYTDQLIEVQAAISEALKAQMYQIQGRMLSRAALRDLQDREKYLRSMVDSESRGGRRVRGITPV